jgi:very-short-patch-repair endonuclease
VSKKANYLIKTLSRTKRKDYENYVINAIWNRLANDNIKPVTQQYVFNKEKNEGYLIDLFFPQLLVGIEIDERHHIFQKEEDYKRTDAIWHIFHKLERDKNSDYKEIRIDVAGKTYDEIEEQINAAVEKLKELIKQKKPSPWIIDPEKYLGGKKEITIYDDVSFDTIAEACNILFKTNYKGYQKGYVEPSKLKDHSFYSQKGIWFPQLAIEIDDKLIAAAGKWNNRITLDGNIIEFNEYETKIVNKEYDEEYTEHDERVVFAKSKDSIGTKSQYRFIGVYKRTKYIPIEHEGKYRSARFYEMVSDRIPILDE